MSGASIRPAAIESPAAALILLVGAPLRAQTLDDGVMVKRRALTTGLLYAHESWDH